MKKKVLFLILPALIYADDLKSLLDFANDNNKIVASKVLTQEAKQKTVDSSQSAYYPTLDIGGFYARDDEPSPFQAGDTYSAYAKVGLDIYDGGKKSNTLNQNKALLESSKYTASSYKKSLQLEIVQDFYNIKSAEAALEALNESNVQLAAELDRVKKFYAVGSVTKDDVDRLEAAYSNNIYSINAQKYTIISLKKMLSLKTSKTVTDLDESTIQVPENLQKELSDDIISLQANSKSIQYTADALGSIYYPKLRIEDTYSLYAYDRKNPNVVPLDNQNALMITLTMRLFDFGEISKQKESLLIEQESLQKQIEYITQEQDTNVELALLKIETVKAQINSANTSLISSTSAFETVSKKYNAGSVDYVTYLDSLHVKTLASAQYQKALNDLQIAYAAYYYYTNKNIKDFIK